MPDWLPILLLVLAALTALMTLWQLLRKPDEAVLRDGLVDVTLYKPMSRLGYHDFAAVTEVFPLRRPG